MRPFLSLALLSILLPACGRSTEQPQTGGDDILGALLNVNGTWLLEVEPIAGPDGTPPSCTTIPASTFEVTLSDSVALDVGLFRYDIASEDLDLVSPSGYPSSLSLYERSLFESFPLESEITLVGVGYIPAADRSFDFDFDFAIPIELSSEGFELTAHVATSAGDVVASAPARLADLDLLNSGAISDPCEGYVRIRGTKLPPEPAPEPKFVQPKVMPFTWVQVDGDGTVRSGSEVFVDWKR